MRAEHSPDVLDLDDVVVCSANASSKYVRFSMAHGGLKIVDKDKVFAKYWTDDDPIENFRKKAAKCAEVLVPDRVDASFIRLAYVANQVAKDRIEALKTGLPVTLNAHMLFV